MARRGGAGRGRGVRRWCGFNYRRVPALALARRLVAGRPDRHAAPRPRGYLQDWIVDPEFPLVWRLRKDRAGSGALGDIGAHIVDLAQYLTGERIDRRLGASPRPSSRSGRCRGALPGWRRRGAPRRARSRSTTRRVFLGRPRPARMATFEATRFATGRKNGMRIELNGSAGGLAFDLERMNELRVLRRHRRPRRRGLPAHPGDRARPPVHLGAGGRPGTSRLRAHLHPPGARLRRRDRRQRPAAVAVVRRRAAGAAGARRRRAQRGAESRLDADRDRDRAPCHYSTTEAHAT